MSGINSNDGGEKSRGAGVAHSGGGAVANNKKLIFYLPGRMEKRWMIFAQLTWMFLDRSERDPCFIWPWNSHPRPLQLFDGHH